MENDGRKEESNDDDHKEPADWLPLIVKEEEIKKETQTHLWTKLNTNESQILALDVQIKTLKDEGSALNATYKHFHEVFQKASSYHGALLKKAQESYPSFESLSAQREAHDNEFLPSEFALDQYVDDVDAKLEGLQKKEAFWKAKVEEFDEAQLQEVMKKNKEDEKTLSELNYKLDSMIATIREQGGIREPLVKDTELMKEEIKTVDEELLGASHMLNDIMAKVTGIEEFEVEIDETENRILELTCDADERQKIINEWKEKINHNEVLIDAIDQTIKELRDQCFAYANEAEDYQLKTTKIEKNGLEEVALRTSKITDLESEIKTKMEYSTQLSQEQGEIDALKANYSAVISDLKNSSAADDEEQETDYEKEIELVDKEIESEKNLFRDIQKEYEAALAKFNQDKAEIEADIKSLTVVLNDKKRLHEDSKELHKSLSDKFKKMLSDMEKITLQLVVLSKDETQLLTTRNTVQNTLPDKRVQEPPKKVAKHWDSDSSDDVARTSFTRMK